MPNYATLLELTKLKGNDATVGLIEENRVVAPEVNTIPGRIIPGINFQTVTRKNVTGGKFTNLNEGVDAANPDDFENKLISCYLFRDLVTVDKAAVMAGGESIEDLQALAASNRLRGGLLTLGKQTFYGQANDAKGFPGLLDALTAGLTVNMGGSANVRSSVVAVKFGAQDVSYVFGQGSTLSLSDWREQSIPDATGKLIPSFLADITMWMGLQVASIYSVGAIRQIDATGTSHDATKHVSDQAVAELLSRMPVGNRPDVLFMSRRSAYQLQRSRSATTNRQGAGSVIWAPQPTESNGIPIVITDSIADTEA
jgi:hypothetical protein